MTTIHYTFHYKLDTCADATERPRLTLEEQVGHLMLNHHLVYQIDYIYLADAHNIHMYIHCMPTNLKNQQHEKYCTWNVHPLFLLLSFCHHRIEFDRQLEFRSLQTIHSTKKYGYMKRFEQATQLTKVTDQSGNNYNDHDMMMMVFPHLTIVNTHAIHKRVNSIEIIVFLKSYLSTFCK